MFCFLSGGRGYRRWIAEIDTGYGIKTGFWPDEIGLKTNGR